MIGPNGISYSDRANVEKILVDHFAGILPPNIRLQLS